MLKLTILTNKSVIFNKMTFFITLTNITLKKMILNIKTTDNKEYSVEFHKAYTRGMFKHYQEVADSVEKKNQGLSENRISTLRYEELLKILIIKVTDLETQEVVNDFIKIFDNVDTEEFNKTIGNQIEELVGIKEKTSPSISE